MKLKAIQYDGHNLKEIIELLELDDREMFTRADGMVFRLINDMPMTENPDLKCDGTQVFNQYDWIIQGTDPKDNYEKYNVIPKDVASAIIGVWHDNGAIISDD